MQVNDELLNILSSIEVPEFGISILAGVVMYNNSVGLMKLPV